MIFRRHVATVAFNMRPRKGPWGGGNQWLNQMVDYLRWQGFRVVFRLNESVDCALFTHAGIGGDLTFRAGDVARAKVANPRLRCIHRINDNDVRKGTGRMDQILAETDQISDCTVFVSEWLRDHHAGRWFDAERNHRVIQPGADPRVFHPFGGASLDHEVVRIVTHHWSDNLSKGFDRYSKLDSLIADGKLPGCELWVIGRWPATIRWRSAKTIGPCTGVRLADLLRQCHAYVSASRYEPGAMHVAEGLQCGLPLLFTSDGGGTVEVGRRFGVLLADDPAAAIAEIRARHQEIRSRLLEEGPSGEKMCASYTGILRRLLAQA